MEKSFIVTEESNYFKARSKHIKMLNQQKIFINKFFNEKGIEAKEYLVNGDGLVNIPFKESFKSEIKLSIDPTEKDLINYGNILSKPNNRHGLCAFKKNSCIAKEFAQRCVDEQIIVNLHAPWVSDYFSSLGGIYGCGYQIFSFKGKLYLKVESGRLKEDDIPKGFIEIKLSEFYLAKEEFEENITLSI